MKLPTLSPLVAIGPIMLLLIAQSGNSQPAPGQRGFWCDTTSGTPVTMYQNAQGGREPWIRWVSQAFSDAGYSPLTRCREVSGRLETYRVNKQLKFLTVGYINRQPVICTASQVNGRCEGLVYTLKPNQDAVRTLNNLLAWREGQASTPSLYESGETPYIDVRGRLGEDGGNEKPSPGSLPNQPSNAPQQPTTGGTREL